MCKTNVAVLNKKQPCFYNMQLTFFDGDYTNINLKIVDTPQMMQLTSGKFFIIKITVFSFLNPRVFM